MTTLNEHQIRYVIIGGIAVAQHSRLRSTQDIDVLLIVPQLSLPGLFEALENRGFSVDLDKAIREFRFDGFTAIDYSGVMVDFLQPVMPAYVHVLDRAIPAKVFGQDVLVSSAEGLIVMKMMSDRPQDQGDVLDLLKSYGSELDLDFIRSELSTFLDPNHLRWRKFEVWVKESIAET